MKKPLILMSLLAALGAGSLAHADDDDCHVPMASWQSREAVRNMAEAEGWTVRRIKIDDGCYEIKGRDASGREVEAKLDPSTLRIIDLEYEDGEDDDEGGYERNDHGDGDDHGDDDDDHNGGRNSYAPMAPTNPPNNGLITPGSQPEVIVQ